MQAEYIACFEAMFHAFWTQNSISRLWVVETILKLLRIHCDNFSIICFYGKRSSKRVKNIFLGRRCRIMKCQLSNVFARRCMQILWPSLLLLRILHSLAWGLVDGSNFLHGSILYVNILFDHIYIYDYTISCVVSMCVHYVQCLLGKNGWWQPLKKRKEKKRIVNDKTNFVVHIHRVIVWTDGLTAMDLIRDYIVCDWIFSVVF